MRFVNLPILTILIGIIGGIAITNIAVPPFAFSLILCVFLLLSLALHQWLFSKNYNFRYGLQLHTLIASVAVGVLLVVIHTPTNDVLHYKNQLDPQQKYVLQARVIGQTSKTLLGTTFRMQLLTANDKKVIGDVLCFFPRAKDSIKVAQLQYKDEVTFVGKVKTIAPPQLYQFDYKQYMERKGVYGRTVINGFIVTKQGERLGGVQQVRN